MAAMTGWGMLRSAGTIAAHVLHGPHAHPVAAEVLGAGGSPACSSSRPEQKARPAPVSTTTRQPLSARHVGEGGVQVGHQGERHRVEPGGIVEGDRPRRGARTC